MNRLDQLLAIDADAEIARIGKVIRRQLAQHLRKRGAVVGLSGGIDSSVTAALCVEALGPGRVLLLLMPEGDAAASTESLALGQSFAEALGAHWVVEDISAPLAASGCYRRRDAAIRQFWPDYEPHWRFKILPSDPLAGDRLRSFRLIAEDGSGRARACRLSAADYQAIVAAMNFKQRTRKMLEYYHADRLNYAVAGTPNRLEYDQGFFVKNGDGAADFKPIAHLYKTQVYALAERLGIPRVIIDREPTTDTYSLPQGQDEFYFSLPLKQMDQCLCALDHGLSAAEVARATGLAPDVLERVFRDLTAKRRATRYGHMPPLLVEAVPSIAAGSTPGQGERHA